MPLSARTNRGFLVPIGVHPQIEAGASPIGPDKVGPANSKKYAVGHIGRRGVEATRPHCKWNHERHCSATTRMSHTPAASRRVQRARLQPPPSKMRFLVSQWPFASSHIITWSSVGRNGKGRAMSDRDMRSEARTFWIMPLPAQPLNRPTRVERGAHIV